LHATAFKEVPPGYEFLVFDFKYLQNQDLYETRIEDSTVSKLHLSFPFLALARTSLTHALARSPNKRNSLREIKS
jgi:hypothetical protein